MKFLFRCANDWNDPLPNTPEIKIIHGLEYPYEDIGNIEPNIIIARDCDNSMILYPDHAPGLYFRLLKVEHKLDFGNREACDNALQQTRRYLKNVVFSNHMLAEMWLKYAVEIRVKMEHMILLRYFMIGEVL